MSSQKVMIIWWSAVRRLWLLISHDARQFELLELFDKSAAGR